MGKQNLKVCFEQGRENLIAYDPVWAQEEHIEPIETEHIEKL